MKPQKNSSLKQISLYAEQIIDNSPDIIFSLTPEGIITYANPAFSNLTGYSQEELIGKDILEIAVEKEIYDACVMDIMSKGKCLNQETYFRKKDGSIVRVVKNVQAIKDEHGNIIGVIVNARDLSFVENLSCILERDKKNIERYAGKLEEIVYKKTEDLYKLKTRLTYITENIPEILIVTDNDDKITFLNKEGEKFFNVDKSHILFERIDNLLSFSNLDREKFLEILQNIKNEKKDYKNDEIFIKKDNKNIPVQLKIVPLIKNKKIDGTIIIINDLSEIKAKEREIQLRKSLLENIKDFFPAGFVFLPSDNKIENFVFNKKILEILDIPTNLNRKEIIKRLKQKIKNIKYKEIHIDDKIYKLISIDIKERENFGKIIFFKDITEEKNREEQLKIRLYKDDLTGLPNRTKLIEDLKSSKHPTLVIINIDSFNEINDFYGHEIGDKLLIKMAEALKEFLKNTDFKLYKLSGDEYAILIEEKLSKEKINLFLDKLTTFIEEYLFQIDENTDIHLSISIGVASEDEDVFSKADIALKEAKKKRKKYAIYDSSKNYYKNYASNIKWAKEIKEAIKEDRITVYYQPILNTKTGKIEKYECLMRLIKKDGTVVSPFEFLEIAKKSKIYPELTKIVVSKAFDKFKDREYEFSINLSVSDILDKDVTNFILEKLREIPYKQNVIFEILESEGIENFEQVSHFINKVKYYGCKIAIDDFGSGYSNFEFILKLDVDYIKIDSSLIKNIDIDIFSSIIVETIVSFSKKLAIQTIAEFVHSETVFEQVKKLGIDFAQGYYISEPKPDI